MITMLFQIFLPCYYGNQISKMSDEISLKFFHSEWYREKPAYKSTARIFMEFAKKPVKICAIGIFDINLATFTFICNSAYSLYAVLKST